MGTLPRDQRHGESLYETGKRTRLYVVWVGMRARCRDPKHISYKNYGGKGIRVDPRWDDYRAFKEWSYENGYDPDAQPRTLDLDRIDSNGPYAPENCQWISRRENIQKQPRYKRYAAFGELKTMAQWADDPRCICTYYTLRNRFYRGWDPEWAITAPKGSTKDQKR
jgi:hypothetical protein